MDIQSIKLTSFQCNEWHQPHTFFPRKSISIFPTISKKKKKKTWKCSTFYCCFSTSSYFWQNFPLKTSHPSSGGLRRSAYHINLTFDPFFSIFITFFSFVLVNNLIKEHTPVYIFLIKRHSRSRTAHSTSQTASPLPALFVLLDLSISKKRKKRNKFHTKWM